jgi:hypothetical protein
MKTPSLQQLEQYAYLDERRKRFRLRDNLHGAYRLASELEFTGDRDLRAMVSKYVAFCDREYCAASGLEYRS